MVIVSWAIAKSWAWIISCINWHITVHPDLYIDMDIKRDNGWKIGIEAEEDQEQDDMGSTAITFILLFLITLLFSIVTTAFKVIISFYVRVMHRFNSTRERQ